MSRKFNPGHAERLNDPDRLKSLDPVVMWTALGEPSPRAIVDVGSGTGLLTAAFARLAPGARVYAADVSPEMLEWMAERLPADVAGRIEPVLASETHVPLPDGIADLVTMVALYHEFEDPAATLCDTLRLLAHGGQLLIVDWKKQESISGPDMALRVSAEEMASALADAGFTDVRAHEGLADFSLLTATRP